MQNFKEVLGGKEVWFEIEPKERKEFLQWAKDLGCIWANNDEINPDKEVAFFHFAISGEGKLGVVPIFAWVANKRAGSDERQAKKISQWKIYKR